MKEAAIKLKQIVESVTLDKSSVALYHSVVYQLLSWQLVLDESSKWSMPAECWLAIQSTQDGGTFKSPKDLTGLIAKMEFHCRGSTFYESHLQVDNFDGSFIKYIYCEAFHMTS